MPCVIFYGDLERVWFHTSSRPFINFRRDGAPCVRLVCAQKWQSIDDRNRGQIFSFSFFSSFPKGGRLEKEAICTLHVARPAPFRR